MSHGSSLLTNVEVLSCSVNAAYDLSFKGITWVWIFNWSEIFNSAKKLFMYHLTKTFYTYTLL